MKKILAILPVSIGGRLTTSSIIDGFRQNGCKVTVFDELFDKNLKKVLKGDYDFIAGYDFSALKIKIDIYLSSYFCYTKFKVGYWLVRGVLY